MNMLIQRIADQLAAFDSFKSVSYDEGGPIIVEGDGVMVALNVEQLKPKPERHFVQFTCTMLADSPEEAAKMALDAVRQHQCWVEMEEQDVDCELIDLIGDPVQTITDLKFWANRFAEPCRPDGVPADFFEKIADRCYPQQGSGVELAHIVDANGKFGILLEVEYDDEHRPTDAAIAKWRKTTPYNGSIYDAYNGEYVFEDRWAMVAFIPMQVALEKGHEYVEQVAEQLWAHAFAEGNVEKIA